MSDTTRNRLEKQLPERNTIPASSGIAKYILKFINSMSRARFQLTLTHTKAHIDARMHTGAHALNVYTAVYKRRTLVLRDQTPVSFRDKIQ